jgi:DNA-binding transcriptional LysR family regulator
MHNMNWDDLRFILAVSKTGSLSRAAQLLEVDHTTVGRRVESAEASLGVKLFVRTPKGYLPTVDAERLLAPMLEVESAVHAVERSAQANQVSLDGVVRVTSPETFGISYLAPRLAAFGINNPSLTVELMPVGEILSLGGREAEIAVRFFRSRQKNLVVRKIGAVEYAFYATSAYLARRPVRSPKDLANHALILSTPGAKVVELSWLRRLCPTARPTFVSTISLALVQAARVSAGIAILPRYLGDSEATLTRVPMPDPPSEPVWLTIHRDIQRTPRVRVLFDFLVRSLKEDQALLQGR